MIEEFLETCYSTHKTWFSNKSSTGDIVLGEDIRQHDNGEKIQLSEDYHIVGFLDRGGQKDVYEVLQKSTGQRLALKELRGSLNGTEGFREALVDEVRLQSRLTHQSVPVIFSLGGEGDSPVFVERFVTGQSWNHLIPKHTLAENLATLLKVARVLSFAHRKHSVIHGDVKPENVMIDEQYNEIYVVDWGMAIPIPVTPQTLVGGGTLAYMPPEIAVSDREKIGFPTDVFMLGATLYRLLTNKAPYEDIWISGGSLRARVDAAECRYVPIPEYSELPKQALSKELIAIAQIAMASQPKDRYADAGLFADALENYLRRENLLLEMLDLQNRFRTLQSDTSGDDNQKLSTNVTLIGMVSESMRIRESLDVIEKDVAPSDSLWQSLELEMTVRKELLKNSLGLRNYGLAYAQYKVLNELKTRLEKHPDSSLNEHFTEELESLHGDYLCGIRVWERVRRLKQILWVSLTVIVLALCALIWAINQSLYHARQELKIQKEMMEVEENVLPYTLVIGFSDNFLGFMLDELDKINDTSRLVIALPQSLKDMDHPARCAKYEATLKPLGYTLQEKILKPKTGRPISIKGFQKENGTFFYFDVASTTSGFQKAVEYHQRNPHFTELEGEKLIQWYIASFERLFRDYYGQRAAEMKDEKNAEKRERYKRFQKYVDSGRILIVKSPDELARLTEEW